MILVVNVLTENVICIGSISRLNALMRMQLKNSGCFPYTLLILSSFTLGALIVAGIRKCQCQAKPVLLSDVLQHPLQRKLVSLYVNVVFKCKLYHLF